MTCIPVTIRRADPDETPLSAAEQLVAISRGFHSREVQGVKVAVRRPHAHTACAKAVADAERAWPGMQIYR